MAVEIFDQNDGPITKLIISVIKDHDGYIVFRDLDIHEIEGEPNTCDIFELMCIRDTMPSIQEELDKLINVLMKDDDPGMEYGMV